MRITGFALPSFIGQSVIDRSLIDLTPDSAGESSNAETLTAQRDFLAAIHGDLDIEDARRETRFRNVIKTIRSRYIE